MDDSKRTLEKVDAEFAAMKFSEFPDGVAREVRWESADGLLSVKTATRVEPVAKMDEAYEARIDGKPYPFVRLEEAPIHY